MEIFEDFLKIVLPASLVLYGMYLTASSFINSQKENLVLEGKNTNKTLTVPVRMQAYERICLLLERISAQNILLRLNGKSLNVADFQQVIVGEIREEFNHNLSQQLYMSAEAWAQVRNAVEQSIGNINEAASELDPSEKGIELSKNILKKQIMKQFDSCEKALVFIKNEAHSQLF
jgi:hypothetical protein